MEWQDIVYELLEDDMINSQENDVLWNANHTLKGLLGMYWIMPLSDEFILEAINASIKARNHCCYEGEKLNLVRLIGEGNFYWNND